MEELKDITSYLRYDGLAGKLFWLKSNRFDVVGKEAGTIRHQGYRYLMFKGKHYAVHRLIWFFEYGKLPDKQINHKNCIRYDNRVENLELTSGKENCQRTLKHINGKLLGSSFCKKNRKWESYVHIEGKKKFLGYFNTEREAHERYRQEEF